MVKNKNVQISSEVLQKPNRAIRSDVCKIQHPEIPVPTTHGLSPHFYLDKMGYGGYSILHGMTLKLDKMVYVT